MRRQPLLPGLIGNLVTNPGRGVAMAIAVTVRSAVPFCAARVVQNGTALRPVTGSVGTEKAESLDAAVGRSEVPGERLHAVRQRRD